MENATEMISPTAKVIPIALFGINGLERRVKGQHTEQEKHKDRECAVDKIIDIVSLIPTDVFPRKFK